MEEVTSCSRECGGGQASAAWRNSNDVAQHCPSISPLSGATNWGEARSGGGNKEFITWGEVSTSIGGKALFLASSFMVYSFFSAFIFSPFSPVHVVLLWGAG